MSSQRFPKEGSLRARYGACVDSFELSVIDGHAEVRADQRVKMGGNLLEELIAESFVAVDGVEVVRPYKGWLNWNSKSRDFARAAFGRMNNAQKEELDDFFEREFGPTAVPSSSARGPGSPGTSEEESD